MILPSVSRPTGTYKKKAECRRSCAIKYVMLSFHMLPDREDAVWFVWSFEGLVLIQRTCIHEIAESRGKVCHPLRIAA